MSPNTQPTADQSIEPSIIVDPRRWIALVVVLVASFMGILDTFIVNVAVPSIQHNLHTTFAEVQLVLAAYTLAYAVVLTTGGRLGDLYGRKRLLLYGMCGFTLASALCGAAPDPTLLILFRVIQGAMAALMIPQVLSIIQVSFLPTGRGLALGLYGATLGLAAILGQVVGGLLIQANLLHLGWRMIFFVNIPMGIIAIIAALPLVRESHAPDAQKLDLVGITILSSGLFLLIYPLVEGRNAGWPLWTYLCLACSLPTLVAFGFYEHVLTQRGRDALVRLALFRLRAFVVGILIALVFYASSAGFFLVLAYYLQSGLHISASQAGLIFVPMGVGFFLASAGAAPLVVRLGRGVLTLGAGIVLIGYFLLIFITWLLPGSSEINILLPVLFIEGLGQGFLTAPLIKTVLHNITNRDIGAASGIFTTTTQIANALGVTVIGSIFFGVAARNANYSGAFISVLVVLVVLTSILCLLILFLPRQRTRQISD